MIKIEHVYKNYGTVSALIDISFTLRKGEITALIGENGAGKSTLMRIMCGYLAPTSGKISVNNQDIQNNRLDALSYIGYVPEISALYNDMSVYDFMLWIAKIRQVNKTEQVILDAAEKMQITDVLSHKIETLSKGYKKRVEIAAAIQHMPEILILDEPTDGLDPNQKHDLRQFLHQYAKEHTVLVSTHVLEDADMANRVIMLAEGKIIKDAKTADFKNISARKDFSEAFRILSRTLKEER